MTTVNDIHLLKISYLLVPMAVVLVLYVYWGLRWKNLLYASGRMLMQLITVGFALNFIFATDNSWTSLSILLGMLLMAAWISTDQTQNRLKQWGPMALSLLLGAIPVLALVMFAVLEVKPWYSPKVFIPLAGMILSNAMTALSLAADRYQTELANGNPLPAARATAMETSLIPTINSFFAVGLVSLPGMMTGQILSGVSPLIAARYQIVVMAMVLGASGISTAIYLILSSPSQAKITKQ